MIRHKVEGGSLEVVCGPMFSGKSEELIRRLRREEIAGKSIGLYKPTIDNRYDNEHVVSHNGDKFPAQAVKHPCDIIVLGAGKDIIGVDEVQFFGDAIIDAVEVLVDKGKRVIVAGLDTDFRHRPFGSIPILLAQAEYIDKLQAVCHKCGAPATHTQRLIDGQPASFSGPTIQVGALDSYEARCRNCYQRGQ